MKKCNKVTVDISADGLAKQIVEEMRNVEPKCETFTGTNGKQLSASGFGRITNIIEHGGGLVRLNLEGIDPSTGSGFMELSSNAGFNPIQNVDLSKVRLNGSASNSEYTICYEVYL